MRNEMIVNESFCVGDGVPVDLWRPAVHVPTGAPDREQEDREHPDVGEKADPPLPIPLTPDVQQGRQTGRGKHLCV